MSDVKGQVGSHNAKVTPPQSVLDDQVEPSRNARAVMGGSSTDSLAKDLTHDAVALSQAAQGCELLSISVGIKIEGEPDILKTQWSACTARSSSWFMALNFCRCLHWLAT